MTRINGKTHTSYPYTSRTNLYGFRFSDRLSLCAESYIIMFKVKRYVTIAFRFLSPSLLELEIISTTIVESVSRSIATYLLRSTIIANRANLASVHFSRLLSRIRVKRLRCARRATRLNHFPPFSFFHRTSR